MNHEHVLIHLREAAEALGETIAEMESDHECDEVVFWVAMQHVYSHLNTAWNGRNETHGRTLDEARFHALRRMPEDLDLSG